LQELLAPDSIFFFNCSWIEVGTKGSCYKLISSITHIDQEFLWGFNEASIAQKMSWASSRDTLRVEDMAYCLMGLFGVSMPLLYGEGSQAFMRLQLEIMKISDDESLFAWASGIDPSHTSGLLANSPAAFRVSHHIKQTFPRRHEPYQMTNKGLQITLSLYQIEREVTASMPPIPRTTSVYYRARLNCHSTYSKQAVIVKLHAAVGHRTETCVRIDCNKLEFEDPIESATNPANPDNNKQIFVYQGPQFLSMNQENFNVDVHTGPLLDHEFIIRTGFSGHLQNAEHKEVVYAREWMFRLSPYSAQSIAVEGPRGTFALNVSHFTSFGTTQQYLSIELLSVEHYKFKLPSAWHDWGKKLKMLEIRRDRATLTLPCGDIVSATLKKTSRGGGIVFTLDFDYISAEASMAVLSVGVSNKSGLERALFRSKI
jgi:hypothetical protein